MTSTHLEGYKLACVEAFKRGDLGEVSRLLPRLRQPAAVNTEFSLGLWRDFKPFISTDVSLLHLAAFNGWPDVVKGLLRTYNFSSQFCDSEGQTPLHYAAVGGNLPVVAHLIAEEHCNPISCRNNFDGSSAIHYACFGGQLIVVKYLIEGQYCDPASRNKEHNTPLHFACLGGHLKVARYLFTEQNCDPTSRAKDGSTPLHCACLRGHMNMIQCLITELGCDPKSPNDDGDTPLHYACVGSHLEVVQYLIAEQRCDPTFPNKQGNTPLHFACAFGHSNITSYLIIEQNCSPASPNLDGNTPLHLACANGHLDVTKHLITEQHCYPMLKNNEHNTPLNLACINDHLDVVEYLISDKHCDLSNDVYGNTPLHLACLNGHLNVVKYLIQKQHCDPAFPNNIGSIPLHIACEHGHLHVAQYLITNQHSDPISSNTCGNTPLHMACFKGHLNVAKYLIGIQHCFPARPDNKGNTPLHFACAGGCLNVTQYLITEQHCDLSHNVYGNTPLHLSCLYGHLSVAKYLIGQTCDPTFPNSNGSTPLHLACCNGHLNVAKYLISEHSSDPVSQNNQGETPLHLACRNGHLNVVQYLITEQHCDLSHNVYGNTPLHLACSNGHLNVTKCLISEHNSDPVSRNNQGSTPLHLACRNGHLNVVQYLTIEQHCDLSHNVLGNTPLHISCIYGHLSVAKCLISCTEQRCDPKFPNSQGNTPLHLSCIYGHLSVTKYLIEQRCDPKSPNSEGNTLLHLACYNGHLNVVQFLITEQHCDPEVFNSFGNNSLHLACSYGHLDVVQYLINKCNSSPTSHNLYGRSPLQISCCSGHLNLTKYLVTEQQCDPTEQDWDGYTPLHIACQYGQLSIIRYLITEIGCDPMKPVQNGYTTLHIATGNGHLSIIQYLITEQGCDPTIVSKQGETPLHIASYYGYTHIVQCLLRDGRVDPMSKDYHGFTPVDNAKRTENSYELLKLFQPLVQLKDNFPIDSICKIILTGNSTAGKTTLAQVFIKRAHKSFTRQAHRSISLLDRLRRVPQVESHTAGIYPCHIESGEMGSVVLYDLAGQAEYHSSHSAVMNILMQRSAAIFINMVDLTKCEKEIMTVIHYWLNFIDNVTHKAQEKSCVVMVGSHADLLSNADLKRKCTYVTNLLQQRLKRQNYMGFVAMDCRKIYCKGAEELIFLLSKSQQMIAGCAPSMSFHCHILYAFLKTKLKREAWKLQELTKYLAAEDTFLPSDTTSLTQLLESLSDKGVIIFLKNQQHLEKSWVVVDQEALLKDVNGTLFAPNEFKEYHQIASNTGIIRLSSLQQLFPQYEPEMLVGFLESLEICHQVNLSGVTTNLKPASSTTSDENSAIGLLFFPAFLNVEQPQLPDSEEQLSFGWCLGCRDKNYQYFTSRFLQVLLLRLAYTFPLASENIPCSSPIHGLQQRCNIWKNGITWDNEDGIRTVVEVIQQSHWVVVVMSHNKDSPVGYIQHRSAVIKLVLSLQKQLAPDLDTSECLISPSLLQQWPFQQLPDSDLFAIKDVAKSMLLCKPFILGYEDGSKKLKTQEVLSLEPYNLLSLSSVCELMDSSKDDQPVPPSLLHEVKECCQLPQLKSQSYESLRKFVDSLSMFAGRNPLLGMLMCDSHSNLVSNQDVAELKCDSLSSEFSTERVDLVQSVEPHSHSPSPLLASEETSSIIVDLSKLPDGTLEMSHLALTLTALWQVYRWFDLGLQLGLPYTTLKTIEINQNEVKDRKREMLAAWLKGQGGEPSKQFLLSALRKIDHT